MKKKILFVTYSIYGGGAERRLRSILEHLDREKFELSLCVFSLTGKETLAVPAGVRVYDLSTGLRPSSLFLFFKLFRLLRELRPDKVFSALWSVNIIVLAAAVLNGIPAVVNEATTPSVSVGSEPFAGLKARLITFLYKKAEAVVTVADSVKKDLSENFKVPERLMTTVHNGISAAAVETAAAAYPPPATGHIAACGGLNWWKNYSLLIAAARGLDGVAVAILGAGPLKARLAEEASAAGVRLLLPGHLDNPHPYFKGAAVFVLTSEFEGFPNVLLEAMACGTPVISVDCPGAIREIIEDGVTGLVVPRHDPAALNGAIKRLLGDRALAMNLAAAASARLKKDFSLEKMVAGYAGILGKD